ncbi:hypothetical protein O181_077510 [Austropuccinia psidii MF-1]|uniref:CCHC-type domain-containing protein n=1 Tax=Austropuccinia psidii MF-1 TaxID=1389203 RepID=A0A9Q3FAW4_9BASI|nr:hypothetical protein [Austropuccinia psidii MF-1]
MAASPSLNISFEDILDIVQQMSGNNSDTQDEDLIQISKLEANKLSKNPKKAQPGSHQAPSTPMGSQRPPHYASVLANCSEEWKRKCLTHQHPCFYCGEADHWAPDCPACLKAARAWASTSSTQRHSNIASIGVVPFLENDEALLDSGDTHSVVGDISLFANVTSTDMKLSVALSHQFNVDAIGDVQLNTIVVGANAISELSAAPHINYSTRPTSIKSDDLSMLWHRRLGHLSIRSIKQLMQFNATDGFDHLLLNDIKLCHPCSIAKAEHRPFSLPS